MRANLTNSRLDSRGRSRVQLAAPLLYTPRAGHETSAFLFRQYNQIELGEYPTRISGCT
jgi:hypothetical protein